MPVLWHFITAKTLSAIFPWTSHVSGLNGCVLWGNPGFRNETGVVVRITWLTKYFPAFLSAILKLIVKAFAAYFPDLSSYSHRVCSIANTNSFTGIEDFTLSRILVILRRKKLAGFHGKYPSYWHWQRCWHEWLGSQRMVLTADTVTAIPCSECF